MSNKSNNNGMNKAASNKGRKGPRPILTVAQLREKMLKEMMVKETRKLERKQAKLLKRNAQLTNKLEANERELEKLQGILHEYRVEMGA
jgi:hypothetical protein